MREALAGEISSLLNNYPVDCSYVGNLQVNLFENELTCKIPEINKVSYLPTIYSVKACLKMFTFVDFLFVFFSIFNERTIVFVSE